MRVAIRAYGTWSLFESLRVPDSMRSPSASLYRRSSVAPSFGLEKIVCGMEIGVCQANEWVVLNCEGRKEKQIGADSSARLKRTKYRLIKFLGSTRRIFGVCQANEWVVLH